jgi:hypothetical protein
MSERVRTEVSPGSWERGPSPEDVRRQLEGRVETVEAARARYAVLESLLSGRRWKHRLRARPDAIPGMLRQEATLDEALNRIQRRVRILSAERPPRLLRGKVGWSQQATARRLLADWPSR